MSAPSSLRSPFVGGGGAVLLTTIAAGCHAGISPSAAEAEHREVSAQNAAALDAAIANAHLTMVAMRHPPPFEEPGSPGSLQLFHVPRPVEPADGAAPDAVWLVGWSDQAPLVARTPDGKVHEVRVVPNVVRRRRRVIAGCHSVGGMPPKPPEWFLPLANAEELGSPIELAVDTIELDDSYTAPPCINP